MIRVIPDIPNIKAHWAHRCSEVPEWLEVPMSNGQIVKYYPQIAQPKFHDAMRNVRNMKEMCIGYERRKNESTL